MRLPEIAVALFADGAFAHHDASAIDQHAFGPMRRAGFLQSLGDGMGVGDIGLAKQGTMLLRDLCAARIAVKQADLDAVGAQQSAGRLPQSGRAPCDDGGCGLVDLHVQLLAAGVIRGVQTRGAVGCDKDRL